jgi:hypothetical protein
MKIFIVMFAVGMFASVCCQTTTTAAPASTASSSPSSSSSQPLPSLPDVLLAQLIVLYGSDFQIVVNVPDVNGQPFVSITKL